MDIKVEVDRLNKIATLSADQFQFWNAFFDMAESGKLMPNSKLAENKSKVILWLLHAALPLNLKQNQQNQPDQQNQKSEAGSTDSDILTIRGLRVLEVNSTGFYHGRCMVESLPTAFAFFRSAGLFLVCVLEGQESSFFRMSIDVSITPITGNNSHDVH